MKLLGNDFSDRDSHAASQLWVERMLTEIETHLPRMRQQCEARDFWRWFRGEADSLQRDVESEDGKHGIRCRLDALLKRHRLTRQAVATHETADGSH